MEVPINKYPWQSQSNSLYIEAFRHFSELCKKSTPKAKIVWGPTGYAGTLEYWPGPDVVDLASITLTSIPEKLAYKYPAEKSIPIQIKRKLHRLRFIDKPVFVLGSEKVKKESFNAEWLESAILDIKKDTAVVYSSKNFVRADGANNVSTPKFEIGA